MWFEVRTAVSTKEQSCTKRRYAVWQIGADISDVSVAPALRKEEYHTEEASDTFLRNAGTNLTDDPTRNSINH
jgi:hypothetical protein